MSTTTKKPLQEELSIPIILSERVLKAANSADSFKQECSEVYTHVQSLSSKLRSAVKFTAIYDRPIRRIFAEAANTLNRTLSVLRRCKKRNSIFSRVAAITTGSTEFRRVITLLDNSIHDLNWLLSIYDVNDGDNATLPNIASTDPMVPFLWSKLATVQKVGPAGDRVAAASILANFAQDDRHRKVFFEEGGVPPVLALLKDSSSVDAQMAAAVVLYNLASDEEKVSLILKERAVAIIVNVLGDSPMRLQTRIASLVSRMAGFDDVAKEEFALENAVRPLVSLLSFEVVLDESKPAEKKSIHTLVQGMSIAPSIAPRSNFSRGSRNSMVRDHYHHRKERENESNEVKLQLKIACSEALWMLSKDSVSNSRKITETKGLLCLSKIIEREKGKLQHNCLMAVMEIAAVAEADEELRRMAFKSNSPPAKSVIDQLLRVVEDPSSTATFQIAAMKAIGSLARTFPARETRVLSPLVALLGNWNPEVAAEAAITLGKFVSLENYLHVEHSKAIVEFQAVEPLIRMIRAKEKSSELPGLMLLCYLALHVPNSKRLEPALEVLDSVAATILAQHSSIRGLLPKAICQLEVYRSGAHNH